MAERPRFEISRRLASDDAAAEIERLRAALELLIPGYEQYLEWAAERRVMFLKHGRENLAKARAALERTADKGV